MSKTMHLCLAVGVALGSASSPTAIAATPAPAKPAAMSQTVAEDPHLWLEGVEDPKALEWVRERNARAEAEIASSPQFQKLEADLRAILDSDARIPAVQKIGAHYYNFWKDKDHPRGLWRRTTLLEYRKAEPQWETVIDLDALNAAEKENWVWHGAECLKPQYQRCLIALSRGGADADVTREFDLESKTWVEGGFFRAEAKGGLQWIDRDTVYIFTDFGKGSMTDSGYPRVVKEWKRGTPMESAKVVYEGKPVDMYISAYHDLTPGYERSFVSRTIAFYNDELYLRGKDGKLVRIDAPNSAVKAVHNQWLTIELREPWKLKDREYVAGSLLAIDFDRFMAGSRDFDVVFTPDEHTSLSGYAWTKSHLVLTLLNDVKSKIRIMTPLGEGGWKQSLLSGAPSVGTIGVSAVDADNSDALWMTTTDFLTPTTLSLVEIGKAPEKLKSMPAFFDAEGLIAEQNFATSKDGTKVPYFVVRPKHMKLDGSTPTLIWGYGGFEVSYTATYNSMAGRGWLQQGGVYVLANIRGGGEYGPAWHQAALKANRHKAYEDFAAVAQDLFARKITSPQRLGAQGGSNGGLLMGNMITQYPELFGAIVCQVPLLDMKRYSKLLAGASWMAEYGDPDTKDWEFIKTFSPYHLLKAEAKYPPVLFTTSTRDDRVHPGHARKMMAKMEAMGANVRYYENIEGGHGGAANNQQEAHMRALAYTFLWQQLSK
ncbi:MAG: prolyl oligopeptidase family serine peptidase [Pseudomonadota bacterium]